MPGQITGGPSRQRLGNQAEIDAAEAALAARTVLGVRRPLPPPAPLPAGFEPEITQDPATPGILLAEPPEASTEVVEYLGTVYVVVKPEGMDVEAFHAGITVNGRTYTGSGGSITEALGIAAGELEEGLAQPVCPHCGQVMPQEDSE